MYVENALLSSLLGTTDALTRVFVESEPDDAATDQSLYPLIVFDERESEVSATLQANTGVVKSVYGVDCRGLSAVSARKVAKQVQGILDNFCGPLGNVQVKRINAKKTESVYRAKSQHHVAYFSTEATVEIWWFDPDVL